VLFVKNARVLKGWRPLFSNISSCVQYGAAGGLENHDGNCHV